MFNKLPATIQNSVMEYVARNEFRKYIDESSTPEFLSQVRESCEKLSKDQCLKAYLRWEGIFGYEEQIQAIIEAQKPKYVVANIRNRYYVLETEGYSMVAGAYDLRSSAQSWIDGVI